MIDSRELASLIWLGIICLTLVYFGSIRSSFLNVIQCIIQKKVILTIISSLLYLGIILLVFRAAEIWNISLLKETLLWIPFSGLPFLFRSILAKIEVSFLRASLLSSFRVLVPIEFIVNAYTFPLPFELIIIPTITLLYIVDLFLSNRNSDNRLKRVVGSLQVMFGFLILSYAVINAYADFQNFGTLSTLKSFLLPILLTYAYLPFVFIVAVYAAYEDQFVRLEMGREKSPEIKRYAKWEVIKACQLNLKNIGMIDNVAPPTLRHVQTRAEVNDFATRLRGSLME